MTTILNTPTQTDAVQPFGTACAMRRAVAVVAAVSEMERLENMKCDVNQRVADTDWRPIYRLGGVDGWKARTPVGAIVTVASMNGLMHQGLMRPVSDHVNRKEPSGVLWTAGLEQRRKGARASGMSACLNPDTAYIAGAVRRCADPSGPAATTAASLAGGKA